VDIIEHVEKFCILAQLYERMLYRLEDLRISMRSTSTQGKQCRHQDTGTQTFVSDPEAVTYTGGTHGLSLIACLDLSKVFASLLFRVRDTHDRIISTVMTYITNGLYGVKRKYRQLQTEIRVVPNTELELQAIQKVIAGSSQVVLVLRKEAKQLSRVKDVVDALKSLLTQGKLLNVLFLRNL
jgi:hypothetical protein